MDGGEAGSTYCTEWRIAFCSQRESDSSRGGARVKDAESVTSRDGESSVRFGNEGRQSRTRPRGEPDLCTIQREEAGDAEVKTRYRPRE